MGENVLALLRELTGPRSPVPALAAHGPTPPTRVYASYLGVFLSFGPRVALAGYAVLFAAALYLHHTAAPAAARGGLARTLRRALLRDNPETLAGIGALFAVNATAALLRLLGRPMSWYAHERACLALFGPPALVGALAGLAARPGARSEGERWAGAAARMLAGALALQAVGLGSGVLLGVAAAPAVLVLGAARAAGHTERLPLWAYVPGGAGALATGTIAVAIVTDIFVPLVRAACTRARGADAV
jgi:hypothetical protein